MSAYFQREQKLEKPRALLPELITCPTGLWIDAASGDGVFAEALIELGGASLTVLGLDLQRPVLKSFLAAVNTPHTMSAALQANLASPLPLKGADGILLANGLHFFKHDAQIKVLRNCAQALKNQGLLILVEYNTTHPTGAVPFPVPRSEIERLLISSGFHPPKAHSTVKSSYLGEMYAVLAAVRSEEC